MNYDVIVIGAGPCGCAAAKTLSQGGLRVLLAEKQSLPRYKSCSGVLIEKSLRLVERIFGQEPPSAVTCTPVQNRGMVFTDDAGREYKFESRGLNIWRDKFDFWLATLAREAGVELWDGSPVSGVREDGDGVTVTVRGKPEKARYAIDCTGVAGMKKDATNPIVTYQTFSHGTIDLDAHYFYAYLQPALSGYDAWFNVKDGALVLGVASADAKEIDAYYRNFIAYMTTRHGLKIDEQLKAEKWLIRNVEPPFHIDYGSERVLRAGEASGFLNPMGEGISSALESGLGAAQAVLSAVERGESVLEHYRQNTAETHGYMQRQWRLVGRMSQKFAFMKQ